MRIQNISNAQAGQRLTFKSVFRGNDNNNTDTLYKLLQLDSENKNKIVLMQAPKAEFPSLVLIDDEKGNEAKQFAKLKDEQTSKMLDIYSASEKELTAMLSDEDFMAAHQDLRDYRTILHSSKQDNGIKDFLKARVVENEKIKHQAEQESLYNRFIARAKVLSVKGILNTIKRIMNKVKI